MIQGGTMKRFAVLTALAGILAAATAAANVRAPIKMDGFFSGHIAGVPASDGVKLVREDLRFVFPSFEPRLSPEDSVIGIVVLYELHSDLEAEIEIPVRFLAVDIRDIRVSLDGRDLSVELAPDAAEKSECLRRLARHRSGFMPSLYEDFLGNIREEAGLADSPGHEWLDALEGKSLENMEPKGLYALGPWSSEALNFKPAAFGLKLKPGLNRLEIAYTQRMFIDERGHGYFKGWPKKGIGGVDYLLYPAISWPLDPEFTLTVTAEIPDMPVKRLFGRSWLKAAFRSNLDLQEVPAGRPRVQVRRAEFKGFPEDVLTLLAWFDPKALNYLDE
jgi:hypothetical protein